MDNTLPSSTIRAIASLVVLFVLATTFLALRIYARVSALRSWRLGTDDYLILSAWVLFTCMIYLRVALLSASTFAGILNVPKYSKISKAAGVMSNIAWALSKTSFAFTLMRLMTGKLRWMLWFIIFSMNLFIALWLPFFLNPCGPGGPEPCWPREMSVPFGIFVNAYSAFLDIFLSFLPWKIIWPLHLSTHERIGICVAMSMGIFAGATGIVKVLYLFGPQSRSIFDSGSIYTLSTLFIWESAEISATIMATSISMLRKLAVNISTRYSSRGSSENTMLSVFQRQLRIAGLSNDAENQHADQPTNYTGASSTNYSRA
ncbi:hypothetical protein BDP67DRAFT_517580 [Colletotrichum lupini]|nr:hypothetical protein BDP67DRAFT_517580 [Colletotrichum lupini]